MNVSGSSKYLINMTFKSTQKYQDITKHIIIPEKKAGHLRFDDQPEMTPIISGGLIRCRSAAWSAQD